MAVQVKKKFISTNIQRAISSWKATCETLSDSQLLKEIKEGLEDIKAGRVNCVRDDIKKCSTGCYGTKIVVGTGLVPVRKTHQTVTNATDNQQTDTHKGMSLRNTDNIL
ncbi:MAG: hypothetical protein ABIF11_09980, partial [Nitrospirota bacterium]